MSWATAWRIARRDLNARFKGLRLLLVCLFLGTGALAAIGSLTAAIESEIEANGREYLGGDLQIELWQRGLDTEERAALEELGDVSAGTRLQAMARNGDQAAPIELKAIDASYPLYGELTLEDGRSVGAPAPDAAWLSQGAADRLGVNPGDAIQIGTETLDVGGIIAVEPDRLGDPLALGEEPRRDGDRRAPGRRRSRRRAHAHRDVTALAGRQRRERPGDEHAVGRVEGHRVDAVAHVGRALSPAVWSVGDLPRQARGGGRDDVRVVAQLGTEVNGRVCHSSCPSAVQDVSATSPDTA